MLPRPPSPDCTTAHDSFHNTLSSVWTSDALANDFLSLQYATGPRFEALRRALAAVETRLNLGLCLPLHLHSRKTIPLCIYRNLKPSKSGHLFKLCSAATASYNIAPLRRAVGLPRCTIQGRKPLNHHNHQQATADRQEQL